MKNIVLGKIEPRGPEAFIDLELLLRSRLLIQANSGGGKSWLIRRLAEQLYGKVQVIIIDREGEFASLREKYDYLHIGQGGDVPADVRTAGKLAEKLLEFKASAVCDLYEAFRARPIDRKAWLRAFLNALLDAPRNLWRDLVVIVDEAHQFCPQESSKAASMIEREIHSGCKDSMVALATVGRKRGYCAVFATQRLAKLDKDATAELLNRLVGMTIEDVDVDRAVDLMSVSREDKNDFKKALRDLDPGSFFGFGRAISKEKILVKVGHVKTTHPEPGAQKHASENPPPPEKVRALLKKLGDLPKEIEEKAKTEADLRKEIKELRAQLAKRPSPPPVRQPVAEADQKVVEVPIMGKRQLNKLVKLVGQVRITQSDFGFAAQSLERATGDIMKLVERLKDGTSVNENRKSVGLAPIKEKPPQVIGPLRVKLTSPIKDLKISANGGAVKLDKCSKAVLSVLAQHGDSNIDRISLLAVYRQSGSFKNTLSSLRTQGYLSGENSSVMSITEEGRAALGNFDPLPEGGRLAEYWLRHSSFGQCERKILQTLIDSPAGLTMEEICEQTGYNASGSFKNSLSSLRTAGVITGRNSEKMAAAENLFG